MTGLQAALRARLRGHGTLAAAALLAAALTASASGVTLYRVRSGDTLSEIAARYHTSVARLVALNHLAANGDLIYAGATLRVPKPATSRPSSHWVTRTTTYTVRPGDSLYAVAARLHADPAAIARRNHLPHSLMIRIGQRLEIPQRVRVRTTHTGAGAGAPSTGAHLASYPAPSRPAMATILRATAVRWHVDPRLVLALAYQESGFNQRWVSGTGAVGAMQVEPYTGAFVSSYVVHRPLDLRNAHDNATAGVALLSVLLRETHGDERQALAGYYQGLASVRSRGMFADTKRYAANVLALRNRF